MNPDLLAACIAWLRANPGIVSAFGENLAATPQLVKFWSDYAGPIVPALPYLVFAEPTDKEGFETIDNSNDIWSLVDGIVACQVFAESKTAARRLADQVAEALNDADLAFAGIASTGSGTVAVANGGTTLAFSAAQYGLDGSYVAVAGDATNGLYQVGAGSGTSWPISPAYAGATVTAAAWTAAQQAGLIYFRRTGHGFPVITEIGTDGSPTIFSRVVQFRFLFEQLDEATTGP